MSAFARSLSSRNRRAGTHPDRWAPCYSAASTALWAQGQDCQVPVTSSSKVSGIGTSAPTYSCTFRSLRTRNNGIIATSSDASGRGGCDFGR